jgi:hypothetical protein
MKKIFLTIFISLLLFSCIIENPKPEGCIVQEIIITEIIEGSSNDIVFKHSDTDSYYINRGLEKGLNIEELKTKLLNKKVTLHLPKFPIGTSEHIAQLSINNNVIYSEFK